MGCLLVFSPFIGAACVLIYQCYLWLKDGEWVTVSGVVVFESILGPNHAFLQWIHAPDSWYGIHRIVQYLTSSLVVVLLLMGMAFLCLIPWLEERWRKWIKPKTKS